METMTFSLESEADEDGDTISKGMILTTAGITSDTYPAVLTKSDEMFKKAAAISERSKVELTVGEEIYYGNYSTNYFDVNGKPAYCLEPLKDTPNSGSYETQALTGGAVRKDCIMHMAVQDMNCIGQNMVRSALEKIIL